MSHVKLKTAVRKLDSFRGLNFLNYNGTDDTPCDDVNADWESKIAISEKVVRHIWHELMVVPVVLQTRFTEIVIHYESMRYWDKYYTLYIRHKDSVVGKYGTYTSSINGSIDRRFFTRNQLQPDYKCVGAIDTADNLKTLVTIVKQQILEPWTVT